MFILDAHHRNSRMSLRSLKNPYLKAPRRTNTRNRAAALSLICLLLLPFSSYPQEKKRDNLFELENGLKVFLAEKHTLPLIHFVFAVNLGTKDESEEESGLVHILEHLILFRGTKFRSGEEISQDIRKHGAYFNAHTSRDLSFFEISLPSEYADFALNNQKEILFNLQITQKELDEEKKVILEEISQVEDDPYKYATSLIYQNLFRGHPYQKPVFGNRDVIGAATVEQLEKFHHKYFIPNNCALTIVGDFDSEEMTEKVKATFGDLKKEALPEHKFEKALPLKDTEEFQSEMDVNQAYLVIGLLGPDYNHDDQYGLDVLTEVLGSGVTPMLFARLQGRRELVHSASMSYSALKYGGIIIIYITLEPKNISAAKRETIQFLRDTRQLYYSKDDFIGAEQLYRLDHLQSAQNQIKFKIHQSQEKGLAVAASAAMFMLLNEIPERGSYLEHIEKTNSSDLRKIAGNYLAKSRYVILSILPKKEK